MAPLLGGIGLDGQCALALHINLVPGCRNGGAPAGHLVRGTLRPTLELVITESPKHLRRCKVPESVPNLILL